MEDLYRDYQKKIIRLSQLLREYEGYLNNWMKINLTISCDPTGRTETPSMVTIEFYRYKIKPGYDKTPMAYRDSTVREFLFTIEELDKAIDRYRKKIEREKTKILSE